MFISLITATVISTVPKVTAGPDLAKIAASVEAPIDHVEVFSDRARVTRSARLPLKAGVNTLKLPDLPGATWMDTLRASAQGAKVLRVEAIPVQRERIGIDQVEALLVRLEGEADALAALDARITALQVQLQAVIGLQPASPVPEKDRKGIPRWDPPTLVRVLDFFSGRRSQVRTDLRALQIKRRSLARSFQATQREVQRMNLGAFSDQKLQVILLVQATKKGSAKISLSYDIPGARWKPAYELHYDAKAGTVALETYGVVSQATGETWDNVQLRLSTAIPGRDINVPELLTWTLGEAKEFIPQPRARTSPAQAPRYAPPRAASDREAIERQARMSLLQRRLNELTQLAQVNVQNKGWAGNRPGLGSSGLDLSINGSSLRPDGASLGSKSMPQSRERPRRSRRRQKKSVARSSRPEPMPSMAPSAPMQDESAPSSMDFESDSPVIGSLLSGSKERVRNTSLALFESAPRRRGPNFSDADLPAVSAAGFEYIYDAKTKMTVPSTNEALRAPLGRSGYPVTTFYEASPALAKNAFLKATVKNPGPQPILRGPVTIFVNGGFAGDGRLATTGAGGTLQLPFGADEDIKLVYKVLPETKSEGFLSKDEVTTYRVIMEVANYKKRPVTVVLREPLPRTQNEDITVEYVKASVKADDKDDSNILKWTVKIAAGRTQTVELVYKITRPDGWQLRQN